MSPLSLLQSPLVLVSILPTLAAAQYTWAPGAFGVIASDAPFLSANGANYYLRPSDGLFCAIIDTGTVPLSESWTASTGYTNPYGTHPGPCSPADICQVVFQSDGNLVQYYNGVAVWQSGTSGTGASLNMYPGAIYAYILDAAGNFVWQTNAPPHPPGGCMLPPDQC